MELREEVADLIEEKARWDCGVYNSDDLADAILSLPRIREALQCLEDREKMMKTINESTI